MRVSILIPCFNAELWVGQAIRSALEQSYSDTEVIVVDDGSTDGSLGVIQSFGSQIRWETGPNRGGNAARNRLLELSTGTWLQYLDADDYLKPEKLERQVRFLRERQDLDLIYSPVILRMEETGRETVLEITEKHDVHVNFLRWYAFSTHSMLLRKSAVEDVGGWNESQSCGQEHELVLRLLIAEKRFALFDEPHAVYRFHANTTVSTKSPERTIRMRMSLCDRFEAYLAGRGGLTRPRQQALRRARFDSARSMFAWDRRYAKQLMRQAGGCVREAPFSYRLLFSLAGFTLAERVAAARRSIVGRLAGGITGSNSRAASVPQTGG